jgi:hypothetical protein
MQQFDSTAKRSAVHFSGDFTAQLAGVIKKMHHILSKKFIVLLPSAIMKIV